MRRLSRSCTHSGWPRSCQNQLGYHLDAFKHMRNKGHIEIESLGRRLVRWSGFRQQESVLVLWLCFFSLIKRISSLVLCPLHSLFPWFSGFALRNQLLKSLQQNPAIFLVCLRNLSSFLDVPPLLDA